MDKAERRIGHAHLQAVFENELVDGFDVPLAALHHEGRDPEHAAVQLL